MKIIGQPTITKYTLNEDGSLTKPIFQKTYNNSINKRVITEYFNVNQDSSPVFVNTFRIATSLQLSSPDFETITLNQINAVGDETLVTNGFEFIEDNGVDPTQVIYSGRFLPPASTRTINSLGIVDSAALVDDPTATTVRDSYTYLLLGVPVTQQNNEILDISYKIFIDWQGTPFNSTVGWQKRVEWRLFYPGSNNSIAGTFQGIQKSYPISYVTNEFTQFYDSTPLNIDTINFRDTSQFLQIIFTNDPPPFTTANPGYGDPEYGRTSFIIGNILGNNGGDILNQERLGRITRSLIFGAPRDNYSTIATNDTTWVRKNFGTTNLPEYRDFAGEVLFSKTSDLSNLFSHNETTSSAMYDVNSLANSSLKPIVTNVTPEVDFPSEYILHVTNAGGLGVGEYKLFKAGFGGWDGNTLIKPIFDPISVFSAETNYILEPTQEELLFTDRWIYKWVNTKGDFQFWSFTEEGGAALWQVTPNGAIQNKKYVLSTYPQFIKINDLAVDPLTDKLYLATEGGLYEMIVTTDTLTQLSSDACASVVVGFGNQVFAIFRDGLGSGRLSSSIGATWATALDLTGSTINWDNVWRIFIDPLDSDYSLMFYEGTVPKHTLFAGTATLPIVDIIKIHWWDNLSNWIQTDSHDLILGVGSAPVTQDWLVHEYFYLPHSNSVQVTNGLWMYPTDMFLAGDAIQIESQEAILGVTDIRTPQQMDIKWDALSALINWNQAADTNSGWALDEVGFINETNRVPAGVGKTYAWGFHASSPFFTFDFDATPCELIQGKPNPGDTIYDLCFVMGYADHIPNNSTAESSVSRRMPFMYKLSIDEGGVSTMKDYALDDPTEYIYSRRNDFTYVYMTSANYLVTTEKRLMWFYSPRFGDRNYSGDTVNEPVGLNNRMPVNGVIQNGGIGFAGTHVKNIDDVQDLFIQAYEWTGVAWVADPLNTGSGKPVHAGNEALIDGLFVEWDELQPGNPQPLVLNQWYNFVKISEPNSFLAETTAPNINTRFDVYFRDIIEATDSGLIPVGLTINLPESPTGSTPDTSWLSLPPDYAGVNITATINGSPVPIFVDPSTTPAPGTIHITDTAAGEIYFAAADSGQPYIINYFYIKKYEDSEVL